MTTFMESPRLLFTSESVTEGHPDKLCDQISDAVLDAIIAQDPYARVAAETVATTGVVMVVGEITTTAVVDMQDVVRQAIRDAGYRVLCAADAEEALRLWREEAATIRLLASDLIMPGRYRGNELAELCQREKPGLPVLLLSGYAPESVGAASEPRSGVSFLQKPFTPEELLRAVREALDRRV